MAKKAKLDILEVSIDKKDDDIPSPEREPDKAEEAVPVELLNRERSITKIKAWLRMHLLRLILVSFLLIGSIISAIIWYVWESEKPVAVEPPRPALSEIPQTVKGGIVYLEGFAVDQKDGKGEFRIAFCDIAIELGKREMDKDLGDRVDVRNVIYTVLKSKKAEEGLLVEKRNLLKAEIKGDLNRLLGEDVVSQVYFTKYELN
jgi:flagellar basal body-associated protein FliL